MNHGFGVRVDSKKYINVSLILWVKKTSSVKNKCQCIRKIAEKNQENIAYGSHVFCDSFLVCVGLCL